MIVCSSNQYKYKGWYFEIHKACGPWPLKKDGDTRRYAGDKFWAMWEEFTKLSSAERQSYLIHKGGCEVI